MTQVRIFILAIAYRYILYRRVQTLRNKLVRGRGAEEVDSVSEP